MAAKCHPVLNDLPEQIDHATGRLLHTVSQVSDDDIPQASGIATRHAA